MLVVLFIVSILLFAGALTACRHFLTQSVEGDAYFASMIVAMCHSFAVVLAAAVSLLDLQTDSLTLGQYTLVAFSCGYFLSDLLVVIWVRYSIGFVIHHVVALISLLSFGYYGKGAFLLLAFLVLGEITNPLQNVACMLTERGKKQPLGIQKAFHICYGVTRFLVTPLFVLYCHVQGIFQQLSLDTASLFLPVWIGLSLCIILVGSVLFSVHRSSSF